jgi:hypothetical protein
VRFFVRRFTHYRWLDVKICFRLPGRRQRGAAQAEQRSDQDQRQLTVDGLSAGCAGVIARLTINGGSNVPANGGAASSEPTSRAADARERAVVIA